MNKRKKKIAIKFYIAFALFILYIQCHTSYVLNTKGFDLYTIFSDVINSIINNPINILHFNKDALWIWVLYIMAILYILDNKKPHADEKWKDIEHGSNNFQTSIEIEEFLKNNTDKIVPVNEEEIQQILKRANNEAM